MDNIFLYVAIGLAAGVLSGFFGIGGGIIIVPALVMICGFSQLSAQGTSLAVLLPPTGLLAFMQYYKNGNVNLKAGIIICVMLIIGSYLSSKFVHSVPPVVLKKSFSIFMIAIALKMFFSK
jgi:uncharacterized membrane protein YfcA